MSIHDPFEKKPLAPIKLDTFLGEGKLAMTGLIYEDINTGCERNQPTFLELEQPRGTKIINMNQSGYVVAEPGEKQRIATYGLFGCTAIGVVATFPDGTRRAHVQHYDMFRKRMDGEKHSLEEMILTLEAEQGNYSAAAKVDAAIMVPGHGIHMEPDDSAHANWLAETLRKHFGETIGITISSYSTNQQSGQSPYATALVIDIPAQASPEIYPGINRIQTSQ